MDNFLSGKSYGMCEVSGKTPLKKLVNTLRKYAKAARGEGFNIVMGVVSSGAKANAN